MPGRHPIEVADLYVTLRGVAGEFTKSMEEAQVASTRTDSAISKTLATSKLLAVGLAAGAVAVGVASVVMASKFNTTMEKVHTQAGATQAEVESMKAKVLSLAGQTAQAPEELATALYHVESVGYRGATAMAVLSESAKLASISGANLDDVTYGLTSVLQTYGATAQDASKYAALFNATVGAGDMQMQDFSKAVGTGFYATAQSFGVSMQSASGALAFMTDRGQGAQQAATHLRMTMSLLAAPTERASKLLGDLGMAGPAIKASTSLMTDALTKAGLSTVTLSEDLKKPDGMFVALTDLKTHLEQSGLSASAASALLANAFGGGKTDATILSMLNDLDNLQQKYDAVGHGVSSYGESWAATQKQFSFQVKALKDQGEAWAIALGERLIPVLSKVLGGVQNLIGWFKQHAAVTHVLAEVIGVVLVGAFVMAGYAFVTAAAPMIAAAAGFIAIAAVIGGVVVGLVKLYQHSATFRTFVDGLASSIKGVALVALHWLQDAFEKVKAVVGRVVGDLVSWYHQHETQIRQSFEKVKAALAEAGAALKAGFQAVAAIISAVVRVVMDLWNRFGKELLTHLLTAWNAIVQVFRGVFQVIHGIFDFFAGLFTGNWSKVWKGIKEIFSGVWNVIVGIVKYVVNEISTIIGAASAVISAIWGYLWRGAVELAEWAWGEVTGGISAAWSWITGAFSAGWDWVTSTTSNAWHSIVSFFTGLFSDVVGAVGGFFSNLPGYIADGLGAIEGFFAGLGGKIMDALTGLAHYAWDGIKWIAGLPGKLYDYVVGQGGLIGIGKKIGAAILHALSSITSSLGGIAAKLMHGFTHGLSAGTSAVLGFFRSLPGRILALLVSAGTWLVTTAHHLITGFVTGITTAAADVWAWLKALPGRILGFVVGIDVWLYNKGRDLLTGAYNGIVSAAEAVWSWLKALPGAIAGFFVGIGTWLYDKGKSLIDGAGRGISAAAQAVWTWFTNVPGKIGTFFASAGSWLYDAGKNIVQGIWNGISGAAGWLWGQIENFVGGIVSHALKFLGIKSPSTVFRDQVGRWIPAGLAAGVDLHASDAHASIERMTRGMVAVATAGSARVASAAMISPDLGIAAALEAQIDPATRAMQRLSDGVVGVTASMSQAVTKALGGEMAVGAVGVPAGSSSSPTGALTASAGGSSIRVAMPAGTSSGGGPTAVHVHFHGGTFLGGNPKQVVKDILPELETAIGRQTARRGGGQSSFGSTRR